MAVLSSNVNVSGRSLTRLRKIASGMRGPWAARANTNTVSPGAALLANGPASCTMPLTLAPMVATVAGKPAGGGATGAGVAELAGGTWARFMAGPAPAGALPLAACACWMLLSSPAANWLPGSAICLAAVHNFSARS